MTRLMITLAAAATLASGLVILPAPAFAQAGQLQADVFGNDPCPTGYICVRHKESDRYRLPKAQQLQGTRQQRESWAQRSRPLMTVGNTGVGSCSAVGPGGREGCLVQEINQAKRDTQEQQQSDQAPQ